MKRTVLLLVLTLIPASLFAADMTPKEKKVRELLEVTGASKMGVQLADGMIDAMRGGNDGLSAEFWESFRKEINADEIVELIVPVYMKHIAEEDLDALLRFFRSPAGQRFVASQPAIATESMAVGRTWGEKLARRALAKMEEAKKTDGE